MHKDQQKTPADRERLIEELKASNKTLETSNEELQSLNKTLNTLNSQLQNRVAEQDKANNDMANLLNRADIIALLLDTKLCIRQFTPLTGKLFGFTSNDPGRPLSAFTNDFTSKDLLLDASEVLDKHITVENEFASDGRQYLRRITPYYTADNNIEGLLVTCIDIPKSEQFKTLHIETRRLQSMVEHLPVGAVYREGNHLIMNRAAEIISGYNRNELATPEQWFTRLYGDQAPQCRQQYKQERDAGFPRQIGPIAHRCKNGEQRYVEYAAYKFDDHEVWILHDVTKRHQSEIALHDREERLRTVMDYAAEAIVVINSYGLITDFNNASQVLFGYSADEAIGHNVSKLMPSPYREAHDDYLAHYRQIGQSHIMNQARELTGLRKDGLIFPLLLTITRVDHLKIFIGIIRDLSAQKILEKQVADISTMEQERIGQEIHDGLGQQLTGLSLMASSVKRHLGSQEPVVAGQMNEIIVQLQLAIKDARVLSHGLAPVPITPGGLSDALTLLAHDVNNNMKIDCSFEVAGSVDVLDRTRTMQIYRIAQEAVNNAVKYAAASKINIILDSRKNTCELSVSDNGCGFLLDDFETKAKPGGMGLRIMHYRAGIIGCYLTIESLPGKGTVVMCKTLPQPSA